MCPGIMVNGSSIARAMRPEGRQGDGGIEGESSRSPTLCQAPNGEMARKQQALQGPLLTEEHWRNTNSDGEEKSGGGGCCDTGVFLINKIPQRRIKSYLKVQQGDLMQ